MFSPKYRILITSKVFSKDKAICLGTQLVSIINSTMDFLPQHVWYGADVEAIGKNAKKFNSIQLNKIGADSQLIEYCSEIVQFIWGEFLCIDINFSSQNLQKIELETEDPPFRSIDCNGILLEIRAFDTSYFEIYSEDLILMKKLAKIYQVELEGDDTE